MISENKLLQYEIAFRGNAAIRNFLTSHSYEDFFKNSSHVSIIGKYKDTTDSELLIHIGEQIHKTKFINDKSFEEILPLKALAIASELKFHRDIIENLVDYNLFKRDIFKEDARYTAIYDTRQESLGFQVFANCNFLPIIDRMTSGLFRRYYRSNEIKSLFAIHELVPVSGKFVPAN